MLIEITWVFSDARYSGCLKGEAAMTAPCCCMLQAGWSTPVGCGTEAQ